MKTNLKDDDILNFWHRVYFDLSEGYLVAAIKRAYRDFNRTLEGMPKDENERLKLRIRWQQVIKEKVEFLLLTQFEDQEEFTQWHQSVCYKLRTVNKGYKLTQGQAQKWINMTLKYLFAIGDDRVPGISNNYQYFHVPIDNIIMDKYKSYGIPKFEVAWSKIEDYESYHQYQVKIRETFPGRIPLDVEFLEFNQI